MKKLIAVAAALVAMGSAAFAQSISAWNEVLLDPINVFGSETDWGQLRERMHASVTAGRFSAEARYDANLTSNNTWFKNGVDFTQSVQKANIYIRPVDGLELILGSNYDRSLPGTYRTDAADDFGEEFNGTLPSRGRGTHIGAAQYGKEGFGLVFTGVENLVLGLTLPAGGNPGTQWWYSPGGNLNMNFAVGYTVLPDTVALDLGAVVKTHLIGSNLVDAGFYVNWAGLPGFRIGVGYTGFDSFKDHDIAAVVGYDAGFIGVEVAFDFEAKGKGRGDNTFQIDGGVKGAIGDTASWYVNALYENWGNTYGWWVGVKPGISCTLGNHTLGAAIFLGGIDAGNTGKGEFFMKLPLSWKYTFN